MADAASGPRCVKTRTRGGTRRRSSSALRCSVTHGGPISAQTAPNLGTGVSCRPHPPVTSRKGLLGHPRAVMGRPLPDRPSDSTTARGEQVRFSRDSGVHARSHSRVADRCTFSDPGPSAGRSAAGGRERVSVQLRATRGFNIHTPPTWKMLSGAPGVLHRCCTRAPTMCKGLLGCSAGTRGAPGCSSDLHRCSAGALQVRGVLPGCSGVLLRSAQVLRGCSTGLHGACPGAPAPLPRVAQDSRSPGAVFTGGANPQPHPRKGPFSSPGSTSLPQYSNFCPSTCRELGRRTHPSGKPSGVTEGADACSLGPRSRRTESSGSHRQAETAFCATRVTPHCDSEPALNFR